MDLYYQSKKEVESGGGDATVDDLPDEAPAGQGTTEITENTQEFIQKMTAVSEVIDKIGFDKAITNITTKIKPQR